MRMVKAETSRTASLICAALAAAAKILAVLLGTAASAAVRLA
jgi:hypothetical protein